MMRGRMRMSILRVIRLSISRLRTAGNEGREEESRLAHSSRRL